MSSYIENADSPTPSAELPGSIAEYDYEVDSKPPEKGGETVCGKMGRKHRMKRLGPMKTVCVYPGCTAVY